MPHAQDRCSCRRAALFGFSALLSACLTTAWAGPKPASLKGLLDHAQSADVIRQLHWKRMPVTVAFVPTPALTGTRLLRAQAGFDEWVRASGGAIRYTVVAPPSRADITVTFDTGAIVPGQHGAVGNTSLVFSHDQLLSAQMEIATSHTTDDQLQEVAAHEFGHALGIDSHSANPADLMSPVEMRVYDPYGSAVDAPAHAVTRGDLDMLRACYGSLSGSKSRSVSISQGVDQAAETVRPIIRTR